jgi:hypothetical protein
MKQKTGGIIENPGTSGLNSAIKFVIKEDFAIIAPSNVNSWEEEIKNPKKERSPKVLTVFQETRRPSRQN